jgi:DNA mismatch repair protein MutL
MSSSGPSPRPPIRRLSADTVERIAAGEVVERPASVVKELLENSLDARATLVTVRLEEGGLERIEVADDGEGIPANELELAVERHATSKIPPEGPVERIVSLGFRGEALAAIASVSRLRLFSRPGDRELAEGLSVVGGAVAGRFSAPRAPGTTVEVEDLFFNTPARRKFLKSAAAELVEVLRTVERAYLATPGVTFRVESQGQEVANYPATSELADAASRVLGTDFLRASFPVRGEMAGGRVYGVLGRPPLAAASSRALFLAVNGRPVGSRTIQQAVRAAFGDYLPRTRFPVGVLHLELPLDRIDVNVHPTKREVRIARERDVGDALRRTVRESLVGASSGPEGTASGRPGSVRPFAPEPSPLPALGATRTTAPPTGARAAPAQHRLDTEGREGTPEPPPSRARPRWRLLGCVQALYWVAESEEGIVLIDQHAASERVLFESLRQDRPLARQTLVDPVTVRLTGVERSALRAHEAEVARAGFEVEAFGPEDFRVRAVPTFRGRTVRAEGLRELLDELADGGRPTVPEGLLERTTATLACHAAIRAGDVVEAEEFSRVLEALAALPEAATTCPHGRPIWLGLPRGRLDRWFLRSGA